MKMRIIGGKYRRRLIHYYVTPSIRASKDRVREAIFNALGQNIAGEILDLFSGFGGYGLEALSRGANFVTFIDHDESGINELKKTIFDVKIPSSDYQIIKGDYSLVFSLDKKFDYIFIDPPYAFNSYTQLVTKLYNNFLNEGGKMIIESDHSLSFDFLIENKTRRYLHRPAHILIIEK